jgi:23S rRNA-/tRNA-specific pseudouridylate synthase
LDSAFFFMNIPLLYEDNHIIAINKPAGLVVHGDGKGDMYTLVDWMIEKFPEAKDVGEPISLPSGEIILRSGIVHRLDKDTTGVMLLAKTQKGFLHLKEQFKNREVEKTYRCFFRSLQPRSRAPERVKACSMHLSCTERSAPKEALMRGEKILRISATRLRKTPVALPARLANLDGPV